MYGLKMTIALKKGGTVHFEIKAESRKAILEAIDSFGLSIVDVINAADCIREVASDPYKYEIA